MDFGGGKKIYFSKGKIFRELWRTMFKAARSFKEKKNSRVKIPWSLKSCFLVGGTPWF